MYWLGTIISLVTLTVVLTYGILKATDDSVDGKHTYAEVPKKDDTNGAETKIVSERLYITNDSSEREVISAMHSMTHQKVKAAQKFGAIPMAKKNAEKIRDIINYNDFEKKAELLVIAGRWIDRDFSKIIDDHNYLREFQEDKDSKATGVIDAVEEEYFVLTKFGDEVTRA
ncbi:DUF6241 domain-containing protein [Bacillus clarus]|nr:DUF6241 domain-containing protein [Bacillus clarus]